MMYTEYHQVADAEKRFVDITTGETKSVNVRWFEVPDVL